jgi:hypothetical protein
MTDEELIREVAEKVMGWTTSFHADPDYRWWCSKDTNFCNCPDVMIIKCAEWNHLTNANHMMLVVERKRELGYTLSLGYGDTIQGILTWVRFTKEPHTCYSHHKNPGHAVAIAALKAREGEKP